MTVIAQLDQHRYSFDNNDPEPYEHQCLSATAADINIKHLPSDAGYTVPRNDLVANPLPDPEQLDRLCRSATDPRLVVRGNFTYATTGYRLDGGHS